jgi:hypothetical protein
MLKLVCAKSDFKDLEMQLFEMELRPSEEMIPFAEIEIKETGEKYQYQLVKQGDKYLVATL